MNVQIFFILQVELLDARSLLFHCIVHCALETSCSCVTLVHAEYWTGIGFQTIYDVTILLTEPSLTIRFPVNAENIYKAAKQRM